MRAERDNTAGVALKDVETYVRDMQDEHCCNVTIALTIPMGRDTTVLFWVQVRAEPRIVGRRTIRAPIAKQHRWPTGEAKTLTGLMYRLCYDLDRAMDEMGHCPAEQATFDWD